MTTPPDIDAIIEWAVLAERRKSEIPQDKTAIDYALRYGGMCRDCADARVHGICDNSGMPCDPRICEKVIRHALGAWRYGVKHGFIANPLAEPAHSPAPSPSEPTITEASE
jgi:hypothetical protein